VVLVSCSGSRSAGRAKFRLLVHVEVDKGIWLAWPSTTFGQRQESGTGSRLENPTLQHPSDEPMSGKDTEKTLAWRSTIALLAAVVNKATAGGIGSLGPMSIHGVLSRIEQLEIV